MNTDAGHQLTAASARRVLVVVPTLNEAHNIDRVLLSLCQDLPDTLAVELVVSDGGSTDGTVDRVLQLSAGDLPVLLRVIHNPRRIQSAAVNLAVRCAARPAEVLVRCDAHAVYPDGFVASLVARLDETGADAIVVPMDSVGTGCTQKAIAWVSDSLLGSGGSRHRGGQRSGEVDHGHHAAFRMQSFVRAGGYDESFSHNEDAELDCRQRACGSRIYLDATLRLRYTPRASLAALWRQYAAYGQGRSRTMRRHPGSWRARQLAVPAFCAATLAAAAAATLVPMLWWWPATYLGLLALESLRIAVHKRSPCGLLAGPAAATMHFAWAIGFARGLLLHREVRWSRNQARPLGDPPHPRASGMTP